MSRSAEFVKLFGGGLKDAGWQNPEVPQARLTLIPGFIHYEIHNAPHLPHVAADFLA